MPKKKRKIQFAKVSHISLCPRGANQFQTMYKAEDSSFEDIRQALSAKLKEQYERPDTYLYVENVFPSNVVYEVGGESFRLGYSMSEDGMVELDTAEPVAVQQKTSYVEVGTLTKAADDFDEKGILYSIAYAPEMTDSQGDFADQDRVDQMREYFMKNGEGVDICHSFDTLSKDDAFISESFQVQSGDPRFADLKDYAGNTVDATGAWAVAVKIESEVLRKKYRDGEWEGISIGGEYSVEEVEDPESILAKCWNMLTKLKTNFPSEPTHSDKNNSLIEGEPQDRTHEGPPAILNKENDMTPEQMEVLTKSIGESIATSVSTAMAPVLEELKKQPEVAVQPEVDLEKSEEVPAAPSEQQFNPLSQKDVKARIEDLRKAEALKAYDSDNLADMNSLLADLEKTDEYKESDESEEMSKSEDGARVSFLGQHRSAPMAKAEEGLFEDVDFDAEAAALGTGGK